jgi:hypothetical protein
MARVDFFFLCVHGHFLDQQSDDLSSFFKLIMSLQPKSNYAVPEEQRVLCVPFFPREHYVLASMMHSARSFKMQI